MAHSGRDLTLSFDYDRDGIIYRSGIRFHKVRACRHKADQSNHCNGTVACAAGQQQRVV
jgi:hypothetical protein